MKAKILVILVSLALLVGILCGCAEEKKTEPTTNTAPEAGFTYVISGSTVQFTDASSDADEGDTLTYLWDFGDGSGTSTQANPSYSYEGNGTYTVKLTVNDSTDQDTYELAIEVGNLAPTAGFTYEATNLTVVFTDTSTDPNGDEDIAAWSWDFGDESDLNTTQNPTYTYTAAGNYTIQLTVTDTEGLTSEYEMEITLTD